MIHLAYLMKPASKYLAVGASGVREWMLTDKESNEFAEFESIAVKFKFKSGFKSEIEP